MLEIMAGSGGNLLGVRAWGYVTRDEFRQTMAARLEDLLREWGQVRLLLCLEEDFQGLDLESFKAEAAFGSQNRDRLVKLAVVGASWLMSLQIHLVFPLLGGVVKSFAREELAEAWEWVRG